MPASRERGFTLIESLIASGLVVAVCLGTAQLFVYAVAQTSLARDQTLMGLAAAAKLDELAAEASRGAAAVTPGDALDQSVAGCHDIVIQSGRAYVRRWMIAGVGGYGGRAYAISVRVTPQAGGSEVRLATIRRTPVP